MPPKIMPSNSLNTDLPASVPSPFLYPVALNVNGRRCVVVGGGSVGTRKAAALLEAGANVTVIAPEVSPALQTLVDSGRILYSAEPFSAAHLEEAFLVIAATNRSDINQAVADAARMRVVLLNLAADTEDTNAGDFATMASVRRGDLVLGVTTGGAGPALTTHIKQQLELRYDAPWEGYVALLGTMRTLAKREIADAEERAKALRRLAASDTVRNYFWGDKNNNGGDARAEAMRCLFP